VENGRSLLRSFDGKAGKKCCADASLHRGPRPVHGGNQLRNSQTVNGITLPYTYAQSVNGQLSWTLTLTTLDPQAVPPPTVFNY
jgi:hypothetical protein